MLDYDMIGFRIREQRKKVKKVSQKKMADDLGMYQPDLSDMENNKPGCGIQDLAKLEVIADYLCVPLSYVLFGEEDEFLSDGEKTKGRV